MGLKYFIVIIFGMFFFFQKEIMPLLGLAALDFIYYIQENCHMHAIASYGFCSLRCYAAVIGDKLPNEKKILLLVLTS